MAREILWYKNLSPAEERDRTILDRTHHGNDGTPTTGVRFANVPGRGKVIELDAAGELVNVTHSDKLWTWPWGFNWTYANTDGVGLTVPVAGNWDNATFTAYNDSGIYRVKIPQSQGGGKVVLIRGVYLASEEFTWDHITADPVNPDIVNYYDSFANSPTETIVTLTANPAAPVQIYYIYESGINLVKYDGMNDWPTVIYWQHGDGTWDQHWAVDKVLQFYHELWLYEQYTGRSTSQERSWVWGQYKDNVPVRVPPLMADGFDRSSWDRGTQQYYRGSTLGNSPAVFKHFGIVRDLTGRQCLRFHAYLPDESDAAWFGSWLDIEDLSIPPWYSLSKMKLSLRGLGQGAVLHIQFNTASINDVDKYTNARYIFEHPIPDYFTNWTDFEIDMSQFWCPVNIYHDGTRASGTWYAYNDDGNDNNIRRVDEKVTVSGDVFYNYYTISIDKNNYTYCVICVCNPSTTIGLIDGETTINYLIKIDPVFSGASCDLLVVQEGEDPATEYHKKTIVLPTTTDWTRVSVDLSEFTPIIDPNKKVTHIRWLFFNPAKGNISLTDVCFGDKRRFTSASRLLLVQFFLPQSGVGSPEIYLDDWHWGPDVEDDYPYTPPLAININESGRGSWQGPTLVHYVQPMVPYVQGESDILSTWLDFVIDAQDAYHDTYGGTKGPLMPLHSRNYLEASHYTGVESFNKFAWASRYRHYGMLVGLWLFNGTLADSSGKGHDFAWLGGGSASYTTGICQPGNTAVSLDGSHFLQISDHDDFDFAGDWSLACVFRTTTRGRYLLNKTSGGVGYYIRLTAAGYIDIWVGDGTSSATYTGSVDLADDAHHLVVIRYDAGNNMYVVIDGAAAGAVSVSTVGNLSNAGNLIVGADASYGNAWIGAIDYLKIWNGYCIPNVEAVDLWSYVRCSGSPTVYPETAYAYSTFAWSFAWVSEYYYFTGDTRVVPWLSNIITWLDTYIKEDPAYPDPKGYLVPQWFWESGYGYIGYDAEVMAAIVRGMLFCYWRTGNSTCNIWIRRLIDDMCVNRYDTAWGGYVHEGKHRAYHNGLIYRTWGLIVNGRPPGAVNPPSTWYDFAITSADTDFYETYTDWWFDNAGDTLPNALNSDLMPYTFAEDEDDWAFWPNYVFRAGMGSSEAMHNVALAALEYGRYSGDYSWFNKFKNFWIGSLNLDYFTLETWVNPNSAHSCKLIEKPNSYRLTLASGYPQLEVHDGSDWHILTSDRLANAASWNHVAGTYDGTTARIYVNGIKSAESATAITAQPNVSTDSVIIGDGLYGSIAEVLIRNKPSTQDKIRLDMFRWLMLENLQIIELIECQIGSMAPLCFCTGSNDLQVTSYDHNGYQVRYSYTPVGYDRGGIRREMVGAQYEASIRLAVSDSVIDLMQTYDLIHARLTLKMTMTDSDHSNPDNTAIIFHGSVKSWELQNYVLSVTAAETAINLSSRVPPAYYDYFCRHWFKRNRCLYVGDATVCHKTETFCDNLGNKSHFGGFKFVPRLMRRRGG